MKRMVLVVGMIMFISAGMSWGKTTAEGFMFYGGTGYMWYPQTELNTTLSNNGYINPNQHAWGFMWGLGGMVNNVYFGGWGAMTIPTQNLTYTSGGKDIKWKHGLGGVELGYAFAAKETFIFLPTVSVGWGGFTLSFETNVTFQDFLDSPLTYNPQIDLDILSVGGSFNFYFGGYEAGVMLRLQYMYGLKTDWHPVDLTGGPAIGEHNIMASLVMFIGEIDRWTEYDDIQINPKPPRNQQRPSGNRIYHDL